LREVFVGHAGGKSEPRCMALKSCWLSQNHRGQAVFHFEGVDSISEAEKFRELEVLLPFEQRVTLPAGQYFVSDLIGCSVFENPAALPVVASSPCSLAQAPALLGRSSMCNFPEKRFPERRCWKCRLGAEKSYSASRGYLHKDRHGGAAD